MTRRSCVATRGAHTTVGVRDGQTMVVAGGVRQRPSSEPKQTRARERAIARPVQTGLLRRKLTAPGPRTGRLRGSDDLVRADCYDSIDAADGCWIATSVVARRSA